MELLKTRKFGDIFNDTFSFLKENAAHLLTNYFKLTGIFLILLIICIIPLVEGYMNFLQSSMSTPSPDPEIFQAQAFEFFTNPALYGAIIIGIVYSIIIVNFMPIYFDLYDKNKGNDFSFSDIIESYKENSKSILTMIGILILLSIPIYIALFITMVISIFTIIGIFIVLGFLISYSQLIWYNVIRHKSGSFSILGHTFSLYKDNFMNIIGATLVIYIVTTILNYAITIVFMIIASIFNPVDFGQETLEDPENLNLIMEDLGPTLVLFYVVIFAISTIVTLLLQINQGIIFYTRINDIEGHSTEDEIDSIGKISTE